jgi:hypothetical protein
MIHTSINDELVCKDIENWLKEYIEVNHAFYNYKFPPCPFAKSARLKGMISIKAYHNQGFKTFVNNSVDELLNDDQKNVSILAFPSYFKWNLTVKWFINSINKILVPKDYYAQFGTALKTTSRYPWSNGKPYFIVIVNKLSDVLDGHKSLLKTDYYTPWADHHYDDVVLRREKMYRKYTKSHCESNG